MLLDGNQVQPDITLIASNEVDFDFTPLLVLEDETVKTHSVMVEVSDNFGGVTTAQIDSLKVSSGSAKITGPALSFPTVYTPGKGSTAIISYNLTGDADITIYMFSVSGESVWVRKFSAGESGGKAGYNQVWFEGVSDLSKSYLGNGIYIFKIVSRGTVLRHRPYFDYVIAPPPTPKSLVRSKSPS